VPALRSARAGPLPGLMYQTHQSPRRKGGSCAIAYAPGWRNRPYGKNRGRGNTSRNGDLMPEHNP
jgi:hypothetical protein